MGESIRDLNGNTASFSAVDIVNNSTVRNMNTVTSIIGWGRIEGTDEADLFSYLEFDPFTRQYADRIINFNPSQGDKIGISIEALPSLAGADEISFASARTRKELRSLSRQDIDLVYYEQNGRLFANGNGEERGWGDSNEGGLMAILTGAPELTADDFTLLT